MTEIDWVTTAFSAATVVLAGVAIAVAVGAYFAYRDIKGAAIKAAVEAAVKKANEVASSIAQKTAEDISGRQIGALNQSPTGDEYVQAYEGPEDCGSNASEKV